MIQRRKALPNFRQKCITFGSKRKLKLREGLEIGTSKREILILPFFT
jgi:hypothetical protein